MLNMLNDPLLTLPLEGSPVGSTKDFRQLDVSHLAHLLLVRRVVDILVIICFVSVN